MTAIGRVVRAGVARRRVQTAVMLLTVITAVGASVLAAGLLVASRAPFDHAFARQAGAHLTAQFDGAAVDATELAATRSVPAVAAAAGPFPTVSVHPTGLTMAGMPGPDLSPPGGQLPLLALVGRSAQDAAGPVDEVSLLDGRWPTRPGEIVLDVDAPLPGQPGSVLAFDGLAGSPKLTVVGRARSMTHTASGWITPDQVAALTRSTGSTEAAEAAAPNGSGSPNGSAAAPGYQMLYRLTAAGTEAEVSAGRDAIAAALPAGALTGSRSYLPVRTSAISDTTVYVPFVAAFGLLALAMSVLIIGIVVSGAVGASTWRIGVLRALGFTPAQVVRAYVGQALAPTVAGVGVGLLVGNIAAIPVLEEQESAYQVGSLTIPLWVDLAVAGGTLGLVALAALLASARAGRLPAVEALVAGRTPHGGRGRLAQRMTARLPLPRPLTLGLAYPFARPARSTVLAAAVGLGAAGTAFAIGLGSTLTTLTQDNAGDGRGDVVVDMVGMMPGDGQIGTVAGPGPGPGPAAGEGGAAGPGAAAAEMTGPETTGPGAADNAVADPDPAAAAAAIEAASGTARYYGLAQTDLAAAGIAGTVHVTAYDGDSSWARFPMISGSWFAGHGEAVVDTQFLRATDSEVGSSVTLGDSGHTVTLRIVGEFFDLHADSIDLRTDATSLAALGPGLGLTPRWFDVDLAPGTDAARYVTRLGAALASAGAFARQNDPTPGSVILTMEALIAMLTLMIVAVAVLGVLDTVVLDTRQRIRDFGILKALGMTPRQSLTVIVTSVAGIGLLAGIAGVPVGIALHHVVVPRMGATGGTGVPDRYLDVYDLPELLGLLAGGLVIAALGALPPAGWAARTRTATALRTE